MGSRLALFGVIWAYCGLVWLYALNTPHWEIPDEPAHFNYVRVIAEHAALPVLQPGDYDQAYLDAIKSSKFPPDMPVSAIQYESHQPPLYYLLAVPFYVLERDATLDARLFGLRLYSGLWGAVVLALVYRISALLLPRRIGLPLLASAIVAFVPQHLAMLAGVNNDVLAEVVLAAIGFGLLRILTAPNQPAKPSQKTWWAVGMLFGAALLTKTTAYVSVGLILVTLLLRWRRGTSLAAELRRAAPALGVGLLLGAAWFARDAVVYGPTDWLGLGRHSTVVVGQPRTLELYPNYLVAATDYLPIMFRSFWGQFGWMGVPLDARLYNVLFALSLFALIGIVPFLATTFPHVPRPTNAGTAVVIPAPGSHWQTDGLLLLAAWILFTFAATLAYSLEFFQAQGRYLFPALGAIAVFVAAGLGEWIRIAAKTAERFRLPGIWTQRLLLSVLIGGMIILDIYCLYRVLIPGLTSRS
jgi:4-amino-4-deoxy-L-arabinose transferase-like glycosyltransferase